MPESGVRPRVRMVNLGCAKNAVDAEEMLGALAAEGCEITAGHGAADVEVVNTCGFIESARQESIDAILQAVERKKSGRTGRVIVTGCLSQRYGADLARALPEVDAFLGAGEPGAISGLVRQLDGRSDLLRPAQILQVPEKPHHRWMDTPTRILSTAPWTAYLKISEGCDHRCTFCTIPSFRGPHVSKPMEKILEEARLLADRGVLELNLIAQDSTQYGYDLYRKPMLPSLLRALSEVPGIAWIRLFYCYPSRVTPEVIRGIAETPGVCQYLDMPLQHADDGVLRAMRRPGGRDTYLRLIERIRAASPDIALRTTFIVGFPGETEAQFQNLLTFVEEAQFDRVGVFEYSVEEGTPSAALPGRVPARVKRERRDRLMRLQQPISLARNRRWVGRTVPVLVESAGSPASGRSFRDGPEVDGQVRIDDAAAVPAGRIVDVLVTEAETYDLRGTLIGA